MIPKKIHYCWFGNAPLPDDAKKCIESWKKFCPEHEIIEWNESNFDFSDCPYAMEAYRAKKWAFVSDYARFKILYEHGGIYFDTDVELIKSIDDLTDKGPFFGLEKESPSNSIKCAVAPGLGLAACPGLDFYKAMIEKYESMHFTEPDGREVLTTVVEYTTEELRKRGLKDTYEVQKVDDFYIYPPDYFCPMDYISGEISITPNTRSIHHYAMSWYSELEKYAYILKQRLEGKMPRKMAGHIAAFIATAKYEGVRTAVRKTVEKIVS